MSLSWRQPDRPTSSSFSSIQHCLAPSTTLPSGLRCGPGSLAYRPIHNMKLLPLSNFSLRSKSHNPWCIASSLYQPCPSYKSSHSSLWWCMATTTSTLASSMRGNEHLPLQRSLSVECRHDHLPEDNSDDAHEDAVHTSKVPLWGVGRASRPHFYIHTMQAFYNWWPYIVRNYSIEVE